MRRKEDFSIFEANIENGKPRANSGVLLKLQNEELNFQSLENHKIDGEILSESYIFSAT